MHQGEDIVTPTVKIAGLVTGAAVYNRNPAVRCSDAAQTGRWEAVRARDGKYSG